MDVLLLWLCFVAVLLGIVLALVVIVRDLRRQIAARHQVDEAPVTASPPDAQRELVGALTAPAGGAELHRTGVAPARLGEGRVPAARRGLGAPVQGGVAPRRSSPGRGLGSTAPDAPRPARTTHRGLGRRPHS